MTPSRQINLVACAVACGVAPLPPLPPPPAATAVAAAALRDCVQEKGRSSVNKQVLNYLDFLEQHAHIATSVKVHFGAMHSLINA